MSNTTLMSRDYADSGLTIQYALLDHFKKFPDKTQRPDYVFWGGLQVKTGDALAVPPRGVVRAEFLSHNSDVPQGFDLSIDGCIELAEGERVQTLRTWNDPSYEGVVEYPYQSEDGRLWVWNVYKRSAGGQVVEEKWTGNAGFWVEKLSDQQCIYHCSHGMADPPDFTSLVFKITINPEPGQPEE